MNMKRTLLLCITIVLSSHLNVFADSWKQATAFDSFSDSSNCVARVTPSSNEVSAKLDVCSLKTGKRTLVWSIDLSNSVSPTDVRISNDGKHVITFDNWARVGYGDDVVAIYNRSGLLRKYSLEELFERPKGDNLLGDWRYFSNRFPHSTSSRWWRSNSFGFFDDQESTYALWIDWDCRWLAWDMLTGKTITVSKDQTEKWNRKCRVMALERIEKEGDYISDYELLGKLKNPEDKDIVRKLLEDTDFHTAGTSCFRNDDPPVFAFTSESSKRQAADRILARWDESFSPDKDDNKDYTFLGSLKFTVTFPEPPLKGEGHIIVYLDEHSSGKQPDPKAVPRHYLFADLKKSYPFNIDKMAEEPKLERTVNCEIKGITPGTYSITALWDRRKPFLAKAPPYVSGKGDVITKEPVTITVKAGSIVDGIHIQCMDICE